MDITPLSLHFLRKYPRDAARILEKFEASTLTQFLARLPVPVAVEAVKYIIPSIAAACLEQMEVGRAAPIITHLDLERSALLLRRMGEDKREQLIKVTSPAFANMIRQVLRYPEGTVGQVMDPGIFTVPEDMRVTEVVNAVRKTGGLLQHELYVINSRQEPSGIVAVSQLLMVDETEIMKNIMRPVGDTLAARTSLLAAHDGAHWQHRDSIPVVDHQGMFIGVLHRRSLNLTSVEHRSQDDYAGTALAVASMFWDVCAHVLHPVRDNENKGS